MNHVLGNDHTINPPILIQPNSDQPIVEVARFGNPTPAAPSLKTLAPSLLPCEGRDTPTDSITLFNPGKKVRQKKNEKNEVIVDLMMQSLEITKKQREANVAWLARAEPGTEAREQKLVDLVELLVNYIIKNDSQDP